MYVCTCMHTCVRMYVCIYVVRMFVYTTRGKILKWEKLANLVNRQFSPKLYLPIISFRATEI